MKLTPTRTNRRLIASVALGVIAAACNIVCSISVKKNPQYIWPSIAWSGLLATPLLFYQPRKKKTDDLQNDHGTQKLHKIWAPFLLEVTAGCVHVVCVYFVLLFLELGDSIVLG